MAKRSPLWTRKNFAIRAVCKERGITEDQRRAVIRQVTGKDSLGDCRDGQVAMVLDQINLIHPGKSDFKKSGKVKNNRSNHPGDQGVQNKVLALWIALYDLGIIANNSDKALNAFLKRQLGIEALRWVTGENADKVIRILKTMAKIRAGVDWSLDLKNPTRCVLVAQFARLKILKAFKHADAIGIEGYAGYVTGKHRGFKHYEYEDWREVQKDWGKLIRKTQGGDHDQL